MVRGKIGKTSKCLKFYDRDCSNTYLIGGKLSDQNEELRLDATIFRPTRQYLFQIKNHDLNWVSTQPYDSYLRSPG